MSNPVVKLCGILCVDEQSPRQGYGRVILAPLSALALLGREELTFAEVEECEHSPPDRFRGIYNHVYSMVTTCKTGGNLDELAKELMILLVQMDPVDTPTTYIMLLDGAFEALWEEMTRTGTTEEKSREDVRWEKLVIAYFSAFKLG